MTEQEAYRKADSLNASLDSVSFFAAVDEKEGVNTDGVPGWKLNWSVFAWTDDCQIKRVAA